MLGSAPAQTAFNRAHILSAEKTSAQSSGVRVSPSPRKMPFETSHTVAVGMPRARVRKYERATGLIGEPSFAPMTEIRVGAKARKKMVWSLRV